MVRKVVPIIDESSGLTGLSRRQLGAQDSRQAHAKLKSVLVGH